MDLVRTPLYRYIARSASLLLLSREETEDIAATLVEKYVAEKSDQELVSFFQLPLTAHIRQDIKFDLLDYKRHIARRRFRECTYVTGEEASPRILLSKVVCPTDCIEDRVYLQGLLQHVSQGQRVCITLRYFDQLDIREIAGYLCIAPQTVEKRIQRGLKCLRVAWEIDNDTAAEPPEIGQQV